VVDPSVKNFTFESKSFSAVVYFQITYLIFIGIWPLRSRYLKIFLLVQLIDIH